MLNQAMQIPGVQAASQPPAQQGQPQSEPGSAGQQVTPEEQDAHDRVVLAAIKVIHEDDEMHAKILQMLKDGADQPASILGQTASIIIQQLDEQSGGKIPEEVIIPAAEEVLTMLAELGSAAGVIQVDQDIVDLATGEMVKSLGEAYGVSEEDIQEFLASTSQDDIDKSVARYQQLGAA